MKSKSSHKIRSGFYSLHSVTEAALAQGPGEGDSDRWDFENRGNAKIIMIGWEFATIRLPTKLHMVQN